MAENRAARERLHASPASRGRRARRVPGLPSALPRAIASSRSPFPMKTPFRLVAWFACSLALLAGARAAPIDGKWQAQFDTQIGVQKYVYDLKADGEKVVGKATFERQDQKGEVDLKEGRIVKDEVSFVEMLKFQDQEIRIEYKGKLTGDELKLTRKVGDFATEEFVAKRVK
jgi:hypothetical protein